MKKFFMCAVAVAATMSLTSCLSEEEVNLEKGNKGEGYISLNLSADRALETRTVTDLSASDAASWYVEVKNSSDAVAMAQAQVGTLAQQAFAAPNTYKVYVSSHQNLAAALAASSDSEIGAAYFEGKDENVSVTVAGTATATCACGTAKNARLQVQAGSFSGTINSLTVAGSDGASGTRTVTFKDASTDNMSKTAYFKALDALTYTINYTINGKTNTYTNSTPLSLDAATTNTLSIVSNQNGSISLTISYNPEFGTGKTETVTIDAATGKVVTPAP